MLFSEPKIPQFIERTYNEELEISFSALQRAENSSMSTGRPGPARVLRVSVLFSEPKIPQSEAIVMWAASQFGVSVLFSEPKIPQSLSNMWEGVRFVERFSALQRAENSSIDCGRGRTRAAELFQCSSASRKFLN